MRNGYEDAREGCPTLSALSSSLLRRSFSPIDEHVRSCTPCRKERMELSAVCELLGLHSQEVFDPEHASVRERLEVGGTPLTRHWKWRDSGQSRLRMRLIAMTALLSLGLSVLVLRGVSPIATPSGGYWRGPPIGMVDASASWVAAQSAIEISWPATAQAQLYVVRVWQTDGTLMEQTQTRRLSVTFSSQRIANARGPLLWSVEVWADGRKIATSKLREIKRRNGA